MMNNNIIPSPYLLVAATNSPVSQAPAQAGFLKKKAKKKKQKQTTDD